MRPCYSCFLPLAWLTFSKLLELMPNGKGWGYDICLGPHLASGVDTSQQGGRARHRECKGQSSQSSMRPQRARNSPARSSFGDGRAS